MGRSRTSTPRSIFDEKGDPMGITKKILLVYPRFPGNNLLNYEHMVRQFPGVGSVLPPLGMLTFAGLLDERFDLGSRGR